jgi:hypothetical protein
MKRPFRCQWCSEMVEPGDLVHSILPEFHYACALRATLGSIAHVRARCSCYVKDDSAEEDPPGLTKRQAARLVADFVNQRPGRN